MPWLTCEKNVTLGLRHPPAGKVRDMLRLVGLEGFAGAYPAQLSGGMQQRAALARTLMRDAGLILMDEPFAALDSFTRETMQQELLRIRRERGCGVILVTHSIDEALILGERVVLLSGGVAARDWVLPRQEGARDLLSPPYLDLKKDILKTMKRLENPA
jgi:sulfonate transport system ATP-binding protein